MDFQTINFEELSNEYESDAAHELISKFKQVQESNLAEFKKASDEIDELEGRVDDVKEFESELTDELVEVSPLSEDELKTFSISRKRELLADFSEADADEDEDEDEDEPEANFSNMGTRGETHDDDEARDFARKHLNIDGLSL